MNLQFFLKKRLLFAAFVVFICYLFFFPAKKTQNKEFYTPLPKLTISFIGANSKLKIKIATKDSLEHPIFIRLYQEKKLLQQVSKQQQNFSVCLKLVPSWKPYTIKFFYNNQVIESKSYSLLPSLTIQLDKAYQKKPYVICVEGIFRAPKNMQKTCSFVLKASGNSYRKQALLVAGPFRIQFTSKTIFNGPHQVQALSPPSKALFVQMLTREPQETQFFIAQMLVMAKELDDCIKALSTSIEKTPDKVMAPFYNKWYGYHQNLLQIKAHLYANPFQLKRLKQYFALLKQIYDIVLQQYDLAPIKHKKSFLYLLQVNTFNLLMSKVHRTKEIANEFFPKSKNKLFLYLSKQFQLINALFFRNSQIQRAFFYEKQGRLKEAIEEYSKILKVIPDDGQILLKRCILHWGTHQSKKSKQDWRTLLQTFKGEKQKKLFFASLKPMQKQLLEQGNTMFKKRRYKEAIHTWKLLLLINPKYNNVQQKIQQAYKRLRKK